MVYKYKCSCCGKEFEEIPLCFGFNYPDYYFGIPPEEREQRVSEEDSLMVIDDEHFFHRCRLIIPINDYEEDLVINVWLSISEENFEKRQSLWNDPNRINEKPYFGWFQSLIPTYGDTINIKAIAVEQVPDSIPQAEIIEEGHQLQIDQQDGISFDKALIFVDEFMKSIKH